MFSHRLRKSIVVIGGSGELGQRVVKRFAKPFFKRWQVFCIDGKPNADASANFVIPGLHEFNDEDEYEKKHVLNSDVLADLDVKLKEHAPEYDAIVNLAGMGRLNKPKASITDGFELFEEYEKVKRHMMLSSMLTAHIASHNSSPDCYILFNSALAAFNPTLVPKAHG